MSEYPGQCFVYLICSQIDGNLKGPCKIGISDKPHKRLKQVQTGSPHKLTLAFTFRVWERSWASFSEASFHASHREKRMHGEWFDMDARDALHGLIEVFARGIQDMYRGQPAELRTEAAEACNLMEAFRLLKAIDAAEAATRNTGGLH
ncbi:T5orf172 domain protein [Devosia sp. LC5]|uniref:GIY-YIG nuclease family protein n=1 Tax=Devosia sp. LC5 TaxID=1502724 RepID=UPI0004E337B3|nr:GIY-YIG nuclease family protein [Devosia sp. LC5]KFC62759.1 T5orf172 domain protein [Devosia sp. LC5]